VDRGAVEVRCVSMTYVLEKVSNSEA
jgi:hypothetical protein